MNIILTIKAVLNYLYNHLIDLINVKKIVFADGTEQSTASKSASLFDIKLMSQAIAEKGFAFMCHTTKRSLTKANVPTLYNDIKYKYEHCNTEFISSSSTPTTSNGVWFCSTTNKYYWCNNGHIYSSENIDLSNPTDLGDFGIEYNGGIYIGKNINLAYNGSYGANSINVYNKNWELIKTINNVTKFQTENVRIVDGYFVFWFSAGNECYIMTVTDDSNADYLISDNVNNQSMVSKLLKCSDIYNNHIYFVTETASGWISFLKLNIENLYVVEEFGLYTDFGRPANNSGRLSITPVVIYNDEFYIANNNKVYKSSNTDLTNWSEVTTLSTNTQFLDIVKHNDIFYIATNGYIYTTNNFVNFSQLTSFTPDTYGFNKFFNFYVDNNNILLSTGGNALYVYGGSVKKIYTDTYTINGNTVTINYYKYNDFKICLADNGTNDTNLETVYNYLSYLNYWLIDISNETICIQRDKNTYSVMFVGDNFIDDLEDLPTNDYSSVVLKNQLSNIALISVDTINNLQDGTKNTVYHSSKPTLIVAGRTANSSDWYLEIQLSANGTDFITVARYGVSNGDPASSAIIPIVIGSGVYWKVTTSLTTGYIKYGAIE